MMRKNRQCTWNEACIINMRKNWQEWKTMKAQWWNACWKEYYEKKEKQWSKSHDVICSSNTAFRKVSTLRTM